MITLPPEQTSEYVYIPRSLNLDYLQSVLARTLAGDAAVSRYEVSNLCTSNEMRVSHTGATVLRIALKLADGRTMDLVAKVQCPDSVNIFKIDRRFSLRLWETAVMRWWGEQDIPHVPVVYDTCAESSSREYWVLQEYFPTIGWSSKDIETEDMLGLFEHVAYLHAYSRDKIQEIYGLCPEDDMAFNSLFAFDHLLDVLASATTNDALLSAAGLTGEDLAVLADCREVIASRPAWVDDWDIVCVNRDFSRSNTAIRDVEGKKQFVSFDWSASHLGPCEEDMDVLLNHYAPAHKAIHETLVQKYLQVYCDLTGRSIEYDRFVARIRWARLLVTLRLTVEHLLSLEWMPWQSRSACLIRTFVRIAKRLAVELKKPC
jgi:hypothetical protein